MESSKNNETTVQFLHQKSTFRKQALETAERLQSSDRYVSIGPDQSESSITKLLSDADKVYEWLIKDV